MGRLPNLHPFPYAPIPSDGIDQWVWALRSMPKGSASKFRRVSRITKSIIRSRLGISPPVTNDSHRSTYPYLSSSHILYASDLTVERHTTNSVAISGLKIFHKQNALVSVHTTRIAQIIQFIQEYNIETQFWIVYVIRGNHFFQRELIENLDLPFKAIYFQNLLGVKTKSSNINSVPLGINPNFIENNDYRESLIGIHKKTNLENLPTRFILSNFDCSTNYKARKPAVESLSRNPLVTRIPRIPVAEIIETTADFLFTISPPGAGPDCYRTWESMVSGSIPIVLHSETPVFDCKFPIWRIEDWKDLNEFSDSDLVQKFLEIKQDSPNLPLLEYFDGLNTV